MSLRAKFSLFILLIFGFVAVAMSLLQAHWVRTLVVEQSEARVAQNIHAAWNVLGSRQDLLEVHVEALDELGELEEYREAGAERLEEVLGLYRERWHLDFVAFVDEGGRVVLNGGSLRPGAVLPLRGALESGRGASVRSGYAVLPADVFAEDGTAIGQRLTVGGEQRDAMVLFALERLDGEWSREAEWLVAGVVLNGAHELVDGIQHTIFPSDMYKGKPVGTATIFLGPVRIATTVQREDGGRAIGTLVSAEVAEQVLTRGEPWTGPAVVLGNRYVSRYDPIRNLEGMVIGMLYIGELEQIYDDIARHTLWTSLSVLLSILVVALILAFVFLARIVGQISALDRATKAFAGGDYSARAHIQTGDEIGNVARSFNQMAAIIESDRLQIMRQKDEIESANRGYMGMLSFATHEFRNSIGSALLNSQLLKEGSFGELEGDVFEGVEIIEKSLRYMSDISDNFLQLSRIERGELNVTKAHVNLRDAVIAPLLEDKTGPLKTRRMTLEDAVPEGFAVHADPSLMRVVFENLLSNAIKYGSEGGRIRIDADSRDGYAEVSVWNEGPAIPRDQLDTLFEKFRRFDSDTLSSKRGAGLGLFLVKHVVERHGGEVGVESTEGQGTRFIIRLPAHGPHAAGQHTGA